ncbi:hypothetical protein BDZ97DRAFT_363192 [Flammula alnicola]|nr:hypothetical protein BDZ97DRAFT_363192 [Flammula alnicola]
MGRLEMASLQQPRQCQAPIFLSTADMRPSWSSIALFLLWFSLFPTSVPEFDLRHTSHSLFFSPLARPPSLFSLHLPPSWLRRAPHTPYPYFRRSLLLVASEPYAFMYHYNARIIIPTNQSSVVAISRPSVILRFICTIRFMADAKLMSCLSIIRPSLCTVRFDR